MGTRGWFGLLLVGLLILAAPRRAQGDERSDARRAFREGMELIRGGQIDAGIARLEEAYAILPHPNVLYNIGLAHAEAGRVADALPYFELYKRSTPPNPRIDDIIASLKARLRAQGGGAEAEGDAREDEPEETEPVASDEELAAVEAAAEYLRKIGRAANSPKLTERADHLEAMAERLRKRLAGQALEDQTAAKPEGQPAEGGAGPGAGEAAPKTEASGPPQTAAFVRPADAPAADEDLYAEQVVSASRFAESPLDAPNATAIVTAQDIRLSGLTDIAELLRRVAGMEVTRVTPTHSEVSIRGLGQRNSNKVLVLVNGRSVRLDFLGTTWLEMIPVSLEEVERIEVIRGPASALYGADAFAGIINIITHAPGAGNSLLTLSGGNKGQARGVASMTGRSGALAYRTSVGYQQADHAVRLVDGRRQDYRSFADNPNRALQKMWVNGELQQTFAGRNVLTVGGQAVRGDVSVQGFSRLTEIAVRDGTLSQVWFGLNTGVGLNVRTFWNRFQGDAGTAALLNDGVTAEAFDVVQDIVDGEISFSRNIELLTPQSLTLGVGYRYKSIQNYAWLDGDHTQHHYSAFLQDVIQLGERVRVQLSGRVDRHPLLDKLQVSPRGSLVVRVAEGQSVRAVVGKAFRAPSFVESYVEVQNGTPLAGVTAWGVGNTSLRPESITSFELGYTNQATDFFAVELNGYFNLVKNAILFTKVDPFTLAEFSSPRWPLADFDDETGTFPVNTLGFENEDATFRQLGGEVGVRLFPVRGLDVYANYALSDTAPLDDTEVDAVRASARPTSLHKLNLGAQLRSRLGIDLSADLHWLSDQIWVEQVIDPVRGVRFEAFDQPSYLILNARLGYRLLDDRLDLGVTGMNLAMQRKRQHPFGQPMDTRVVASAKVRF